MDGYYLAPVQSEAQDTHTGTARRQMAAGNQLGSSQMTGQQADEEAGGGGGYYIGSSWHIVFVFWARTISKNLIEFCVLSTLQQVL